MNIGFDAKRYFRNITGLGNYSRDVISAFIKLYPENQFHLYTPKLKDQNSSIKLPKLDGFNNFHTHIPLGLYKNFKSYWRSIALERSLIRDKIDIYHGLSHEIPKRKFNSKVKYAVTIHDLIFLRYPKNYKKIDAFTYNKKAKYACEKSDVIFTITEQTKNDIIDFYNIYEEKIKVKHISCNSIFQKVCSEQEKEKVRAKYQLPNNFILNINTIEKRKNIEAILHAMYIGKLDTFLVIIGKKTTYFSVIQETIQKYKLQSKVLIIDNADFNDFPALYQMADVFIYPSHFEGFGLPVLEAMTSGTAIVTSSNSTMQEFALDSALYANPTDYEELSAKIKLLLSDNELRNSLQEKAKIRSHEFSPENLVQFMYKEYLAIP